MKNNPTLSYLADEIIRFFTSTEVELQILRKYNKYRSMDNKNESIKDLLAKARAIHYAMQNGAITYEEAKRLTNPILLRVNDHVDQIAKQCKMKPRHIKFQDLGRKL